LDHLPEIVMLIRTLAYRVSSLCTTLTANYTQKKNMLEVGRPVLKALAAFTFSGGKVLASPPRKRGYEVRVSCPQNAT